MRRLLREVSNEADEKREGVVEGYTRGVCEG